MIENENIQITGKCEMCGEKEATVVKHTQICYQGLAHTIALECQHRMFCSGCYQQDIKAEAACLKEQA